MTTHPDYIALETSRRDGTLYDPVSGFSISGAQVKPYPSDPAQRKAVDSRLYYGILVEATEEEFMEQNPAVVVPPAAVVLTEPVYIEPDINPEDYAVVMALTPATSAAFVSGEIDVPEDQGYMAFVALIRSVSSKQFFTLVIPAINNSSDLTVGYGFVITDGLKTVGSSDNNGTDHNFKTIGQVPALEDLEGGVVMRGVNATGNPEDWMVSFGDEDLTDEIAKYLEDHPQDPDLSDYYTKDEVDSMIEALTSRVEALENP